MYSTNYKLTTPLQKVLIITQYCITFYNLILNTSVCMNVDVFDENGKAIETFKLILEGDDYNNWGNNDNYIKTFVEAKINELYPVIPNPSLS